ncbi:hypothetical protein AGMMS50296_4490 [Alphaproteobacteria bacterium]|nr:hypothetical protein AGMMS50296_4490 [Alphaproteobacteria bacterium]
MTAYTFRKLLNEKKFEELYTVLTNCTLSPEKNLKLYNEALWLLGFLSLNWRNDPYRALSCFNRLLQSSHALSSQARTAFWLGMAFKQLEARDVALLWFQRTATFSSTFYGQLAQVFLYRFSSPYVWVTHPETFLNPTAPVPAHITDSAAFNLISAFQANNLFHGTQKEKSHTVNLVYNRMPDFMSKIALLKSMYHLDPSLTVFVYEKIKHDYKTVSFLGYPLLSQLAPAEKLENLYNTLSGTPAQKQFIKTLAHAVVLVESEFRARANSPAGAEGLMQMMPDTAKEEKQKLTRGNLLKKDVSFDLRKASDNLVLGSSHLQTLIAEFGDNIVLIAAAYNAGRGNVRKWLEKWGDPRLGTMSTLLWIELIPFSETRRYVKKIIEAFVVYTKILNTEFLQSSVWALF